MFSLKNVRESEMQLSYWLPWAALVDCDILKIIKKDGSKTAVFSDSNHASCSEDDPMSSGLPQDEA